MPVALLDRKSNHIAQVGCVCFSKGQCLVSYDASLPLKTNTLLKLYEEPYKLLRLSQFLLCRAEVLETRPMLQGSSMHN